jgi:hypothetical protein
MRKQYFAYNLTDQAQSELFSRFKPLFENIKGDHITHQFNICSEDLLPDASKATIVGYSKNENIECVVVEILGSINRPDGKIYHITISHNDLAKPVDSNSLLASIGYFPVDRFQIDILPAKNYR